MAGCVGYLDRVGVATFIWHIRGSMKNGIEEEEKKAKIKTSKNFSLKLKMFRIFFMSCWRNENVFLRGQGEGRRTGPFKGLRTGLGWSWSLRALFSSRRDWGSLANEWVNSQLLHIIKTLSNLKLFACILLRSAPFRLIPFLFLFPFMILWFEF